MVFGLSLTLFEYMGVNRKKIVSLVGRNRNNIFIHNTGFMDGEIRGVVGYNTHYILPLASVFLEA
jgi:hypothetical protein